MTQTLEFSKLIEDLKVLEQETLIPEGYELYDFGGNNFVAPTSYLDKDDKLQPIEGSTLTHMVAIYKQNGDKQFVFCALEVDPEKYDIKELSAAFKRSIVEGREKYPDLA